MHFFLFLIKHFFHKKIKKNLKRIKLEIFLLLPPLSLSHSLTSQLREMKNKINIQMAIKYLGDCVRVCATRIKIGFDFATIIELFIFLSFLVYMKAISVGFLLL